MSHSNWNSSGMITTDLNKFGPFGRYNGLTIVTNGSLDFSSGSNVGAAGFIISGSKHGPISGRVKLPRGGFLEITSMSMGVVHEIGPAVVTSDNATTHICVLRR